LVLRVDGNANGFLINKSPGSHVENVGDLHLLRRDTPTVALVNGVVDQVRFQEVAGDITDTILGDLVNLELDFLEMGEATCLDLGDISEERQDALGGPLADAVALADA
jgi:hypothetical protein